MVDKGRLSVCCQHFQRTSPLKLLAQFHLNSYSVFRHIKKEVYIFGPRHMTKVTDTPIYNKNLKQFTNTMWQFALNLVSSILEVSSSICI